jgi:DtxR family Mn-dependent transcriptional regulator
MSSLLFHRQERFRDMDVRLIVIGLLGMMLVALGWWGVLRWRHSHRLYRRILIEDALKHVHNRQHQEMPATTESLAGALGLSTRAVVSLVERMVRQRLLTVGGDGLKLTPEGEGWALQVIRAHRLWERYLADEVGTPLGKQHAVAERHEHALTPEETDALEVQLGYPRTDPHGDPIPSVGGELVRRVGKSLTDWPLHTPARVVHIEDEPESIFVQIIAEGLLPGIDVVVQRTGQQGLLVDVEGSECWLAPVVAANIFVIPVPVEHEIPTNKPRLSSLRPGRIVRISAISPEVRGLTRRRFLDLGLTPGTPVEAELRSAFGSDPTAYRVRGTLIALRRDQADRIFIEE